MKVINWIKRNIDTKQYDVIIWAYIDEIVFSIMCRNSANRVLFMDHLIGEISNSKVKKIFFQGIKKSYEYIAFEDYIKDFVKGIDKNRTVWVVKHPLPVIPELGEKKNNLDTENKNVIFAPALSNDEEFIDYLIKNAEKIPKKIKIIIRSTEKEYFSSNLEVYKNRISDEKYYTSIRDSVAVLIHYGENYNYRTSGVLYEAVQMRKPVILFCGNTLDNYYKLYPNIIRAFYSNNEFMQSVDRWIKDLETVNCKDFDKILSDYSDNDIRHSLDVMFNHR